MIFNFQDPKTKKTQAVKAAELAEDWDEEGEEENGDEKLEKVPETEKTEEKSEKMAEADVDTTPVRKSGRAPKPTEKLLEGKQQVGLSFNVEEITSFGNSNIEIFKHFPN